MAGYIALRPGFKIVITYGHNSDPSRPAAIASQMVQDPFFYSS